MAQWWKVLILVVVFSFVMYGMGLLQVRSDTAFYERTGGVWESQYDSLIHLTDHWNITRKVADYMLLSIVIAAVVLVLVARTAPLLVIVQRLLFIVTLLYLIRAIALSVTNIPPPNSHCQLVVADNVKEYFELSIGFMAGRMSCTDLMFSGHVLSVVIAAFVVDFYVLYKALSVVFYILALVASVMVIAAKMHYTVDVFIAWVMTFFVFTWYHLILRSINADYLPRNVVIVPVQRLVKSLEN